jgi:CRISPR system Cascade subunit CasD
MPHTVLIPLIGPMQSWGSRSRFSDRDTHREPTKSGVLGLICAALGRNREQSLEDLNALSFGVRVDKAGHPQRDYQTAMQDEGSDATLSIRHYIADARFLVGLEGEDIALLRQIAGALQNPIWTLSLGRKSYPLALPPCLPKTWGGSLRENMGLQEALSATPWLCLYPNESKNTPPKLLLFLEKEDGAISQLDSPNSFRYRARHFAPRNITSIEINTQENRQCIYQD